MVDTEEKNRIERRSEREEERPADTMKGAIGKKNVAAEKGASSAFYRRLIRNEDSLIEKSGEKKKARTRMIDSCGRDLETCSKERLAKTGVVRCLERLTPDAGMNDISSF